MTQASFILADGFPPALVFVGFVVLMLIGTVFNKAKPTGATPRVPPGGGDAEAARLRAIAQRHAEAQGRAPAKLRGGGVAPPPMPAGARGRKAKAAARAAAKTLVPAASATIARVTVAEAEPLAPVANRQAQSAIGRNLKLMLQRGAVREAVLLGDVLGPPKSLRDEE